MTALMQLLQKLQNSSPLTPDDVVALFLALTMLASAAHLVTMLITRWGDRNTAIKALLGSVLIHSVCFLGLEVFEPVSAQAAERLTELPEDEEIRIETLVESDRDVNLPQSGNTPLLDAPNRPETELQRMASPSPEMTELMTPERTPAPVASGKAVAEDISQFEPREVSEIAPMQDAGIEGSRQVATSDPAAELQTQFEVSQADVLTERITRLRPQMGREQEPTEFSEPDRSAQAPRTELQVTAADRAPVAELTDQSSGVRIPQLMDQTDSIARPVAPDDNNTFLEGIAATTPAPRQNPAAAMTFQNRLPRPSQARPEPTPLPRPTRTTDAVAATPLPLSNDYEDVRIGSVSPEFADALISAAEQTLLSLQQTRRRDGPPATYRLRDIRSRSDTALQNGGTKQSENAVERSLRWFASIQSADGRWDASDYDAGLVKIDENNVDRNFAGRNADTGLTALVVLSFLGAGYTHEQGPYALQVDHALDWLISQQGSDGNLFGNAEHYAQMYCHGMATYALAEAWAMQNAALAGPIIDPLELSDLMHSAEAAAMSISNTMIAQPLWNLLRLPPSARIEGATRAAWRFRRVSDIDLRAALVRALTFTMGQQDPVGGGWRYRRGQSGDVSMLGWHLMALKSAEIGGIAIPAVVRQRMNLFLNQTAQGNARGLFGYRRTISGATVQFEQITPTMTAEALFCRQMLGSQPDSPATREAIGLLVRNPPGMARTNFYYWYYASLAMFQQGGDVWEQWNRTTREILIDTQVASGPLAGSWDPTDPWGRYGGRLYSTALATLTLEVYYRLLPLYRTGRSTDDETVAAP